MVKLLLITGDTRFSNGLRDFEKYRILRIYLYSVRALHDIFTNLVLSMMGMHRAKSMGMPEVYQTLMLSLLQLLGGGCERPHSD